MRIFLTGSGGFIGRNLKERLSGRYELYSPSSKELNLLDEAQVDDCLMHGSFDAVIHASTWNATATSVKDVSQVLRNNLRMFFNLARGTSHYGKMIYYGSGAEYDKSVPLVRVGESSFGVRVPHDDYGFSKYVMARHAERSRNIYNLRLFGVFGKYEDWRIRFISNACCKAIFDMPITMRQNVLFDYMHVDDVVSVTEWFLNHEPRESTYNVCTGAAVDLLTLAERVIAVSGKRPEIRVSRPGMGNEYSGDNSRLIGEIGEYAFRDLDGAIREMYRWYLERQDSIDRESLLVDK